ncbi:hypothetical protein BC832DRAFT_593527 [Gaertneriomyces semiglobifer]|nr:hypothetical protein BC832DRAFT_593527 [Gaertneriomyces semiglobifer]
MLSKQTSHGNIPLGDSRNPYDLLIIGAGPHALTLMLRLLTKYPVSLYNDEEHKRLLQHKRHLKTADIPNGRKRRYVVIDESGQWLGRWTRLFSGYGIEWLRSLVDINPDASGSSSLRDFAMSQGRMDEIKEINEFVSKALHTQRNRRRSNASFNHAQNTSLHIPTSSLFIDFCHHLIAKHQLNHILQPGTVQSITPLYTTSDACITCKGFEIDLLQNGSPKKIHARRVVCAIGNGNCLRLPEWADTCKECSFTHWPGERLMHSAELVQYGVLRGRDGWERKPDVKSPLESTNSGSGERVLMIVGGGLTAGHLVKYGLKRFDGSYIRVKQFDVSLNWVDRYGNIEMAKFWQEENYEARLAIIQKAREGGSMTPLMWEFVKSTRSTNRLDIRQCTKITNAVWKPEATSEVSHDAHQAKSADSGYWEVDLSDGSTHRLHSIWMATGSKMNAMQDPLLSKLHKSIPTTLVEGFPVLTRDLRWHPSIPLHIIGGYAALELGPQRAQPSGSQDWV